MSKLIIIRGLPGSGKSTLARALLKSLLDNDVKAMIVCRDDLRAMGGFGKAPDIYENVVSAQQTALVREGLKKGYTVISADTNLNGKYVKALAKHAEFFGAEVEVVDLDVDLDECIRRDSARDVPVGADVIRKMHRRYFHKWKFPANPLIGRPAPAKLEPYERDTSLPKLKIYDVDGTLANHDGKRSPYDYNNVHLDTPHEDVIQQMRDDYALGYNLAVLSGREDFCRLATEEWLRLHTQLPVGTEIPLFMRPTDDSRADFIVKYEIFMREFAPHYNVVCVYDDRNQVIRMWRDIGVRAFQVNDGDF